MKQMPQDVQLAMGRIFRMMSRPYQAGDETTYEVCRSIILNASDPIESAYVPNYARDRNNGAQGD